jgi:hypothetical protein
MTRDNSAREMIASPVAQTVGSVPGTHPYEADGSDGTDKKYWDNVLDALFEVDRRLPAFLQLSTTAWILVLVKVLVYPTCSARDVN